IYDIVSQYGWLQGVNPQLVAIASIFAAAAVDIEFNRPGARRVFTVTEFSDYLAYLQGFRAYEINAAMKVVALHDQTLIQNIFLD
ncbi:hypothetical protein HDU76_006487, partial [Blyttiomyces sp. JEL0837]